MKIRTFSFKNNVSGWNVNKVHFDNLTLFVGASGVGKTQILRAIGSLKKIVNGDSVNGAEWAVEFEENGAVFNWKGAFNALETN